MHADQVDSVHFYFKVCFSRIIDLFHVNVKNDVSRKVRTMMVDRSTMKANEYITKSVYWCLISMIWYKNLLFRCLPNTTYSTSRFVLWVMIFVSIIACSGWLFKNRRTGWSILKSLLFPYGFYTVFTYWKTFRVRIILVFLIASVISLLIGTFLMTRRINRRKKVKRIIKRRFFRCMVVTGDIITVAFAIIMIPVLLKGVFGMALFRPNTDSKIGNTAEEQTISFNIGTVTKLKEDEWKLLSTNDKLNVLQCVANIEAYHLGLPNELNVSAANLEVDTVANYSDAFHRISISLEHLENDTAEELLKACCHEAFHSYQHRLVDAYNESSEENKNLRIYKKVIRYADEFDSYLDGDDDFWSYYFQQCEKDARAYAEDAVRDYYSKIEEYSEEN